MLSLVALALASQASAQTAETPTALVDRALDLREAGNDVEAHALILRAHAQTPTPRITAQLGMVEQALGMWVAAETHLAAALDARSDPWIRRAAATLEQGLEAVRQRLGNVEILTSVPGATVSVGGEVVGTTPLAGPVRAQIGTVSVEVSLEGYRPQTLAVVVTPGTLTRQYVNLVPVPTVETSTVAVAAPVDPVDEDTVGVSPRSGEDGGAITEQWWLWTIVGVVVVGAALGIGLGVGLSSSSTVEAPIPGDVGPGGVVQTLTVATW